MSDSKHEPELTVHQCVAERVIAVSDGATIVLRRYGQIDAPRLALSHGNGLAIDGYVKFWERLCQNFDVVLFDMRNHGRNALHDLNAGIKIDPAQHNWPRMTQDMAEIRSAIDHEFGAKRVTGVFHSMSAVAALLSVLSTPAYPAQSFDSLVLFDPPLYPPLNHALHGIAFNGTEVLARRTERRPPTYADPMELASQFKRKDEFRGWIDGAAEDIARATLIKLDDTDDGTSGATEAVWQLACPRELEARMYETNRDSGLWPHLLKPVTTPFKIVGADPTIDSAQAPARICQALSQVAPIDYEFVANSSHFMQIEQPDACAQIVSDFTRQLAPPA